MFNLNVGLIFVGLICIIAAQQSEIEGRYCNNSCTTYFDGCNDCTCNNDGTSTCGNNVCENYTESYCTQCKSNTEWNECGSSCTKQCNDDPLVLCTQECVPKCECPEEYPMWDEINNQCIAESNCTVIGSTVSEFNFDAIYCEEGCTSYFDGCNECHCNGNVTSTCTNNVCEESQDHYCLACISNKEWTECGSSCVATCEEPLPICEQDCESTCYCPYNTVWNGTQCVTLEECENLKSCTCEPINSNSARILAYCNAFTEESTCNSQRCEWLCTLIA